MSEFRAVEWRALLTHLDQSASSSSFVHLCGGQENGKTTLAKELVDRADGVYVDCNDVLQCEKTFYAHIVQRLALVLRLPLPADSPLATVQQFVHAVRRLVHKSKNECTLLALDNVEALRGMPDYVYPAIANLPLLTGHRLHLLTVSHLAFRKFQIWYHRLDLSPVQIACPSYTKEDICTLIVRHLPVASELYVEVVHRVVQCMYDMHCRHLSALKPIVTHVWAGLLRDLEVQRCAEFEAEEDESLDMEDEEVDDVRERITAENIDKQKISQVKMWKTLSRLITEASLYKQGGTPGAVQGMPALRRLLLVACYCTSYNPPKYDARLFVKAKTNRGRAPRRPFGGLHASDSLHNRGPAAVPLARVTHAFRALAQCHMCNDDGTSEWHGIDIKAITKHNVLTQLSTLISNRDVALVSAMANVSEPKVRCLLDLDSVRLLASSIDVHIDTFLIDFAS